MKKWIVILFALTIIGAYVIIDDSVAPSGNVKENFGENWAR
jgi:hypothetical protein